MGDEVKTATRVDYVFIVNLLQTNIYIYIIYIYVDGSVSIIARERYIGRMTDERAPDRGKRKKKKKKNRLLDKQLTSIIIIIPG